MGKYGRAAVESVKLLNNGTTNSPEKAWYMATASIFGEGTSGQYKGCPKSSFLGLCEEGLVKGIQTGIYTKSIKNKDYAIKAVELLRTTPSLSNTPEKLWMLVTHGEPKIHNHQMDVVISLWNINMIE